tara:strand:- start:6 stop:527 length:522 start_codon:yes stop_codon:yes gene_type:complete
MPLNLEQKKDLVKEVADVVANADTLLTADFRGLTANELGEFRKIARNPGIFIKVVKNNMLKMALKDSDYESISDKVNGPQILATSSENPGDFAKLVKKFLDDHETIELKSLAYKGKELELSEIKKLASLPSREQALAQLMSVMQAPIQKLLSTMNAVPSKMVRTLDAVKQSKN